MAIGETHTVVVDVMGADSGVYRIVKGGLDAARRRKDRLHVVLVGDKAQIEQVLSQQRRAVPPNISIEHAPEVIPMGIPATEGVRIRNSSVAVGLRMIKEGRAHAFVSPGNTGAVMASALLILGRMEGVIRPAIAAFFPTVSGRPIVVLDVGANADCKPLHLFQFAVMGSVYTRLILNLDDPRVGLISIGEERSKGNELVFNAQRLLADSSINFVGNIEGRDVLHGTVDVAVTDGFTGNILLKFAESVKPLLVKWVQRQIQTNIFSRLGAILLLPFLKRMKNTFDYAEYGGAPLLGVEGNVVICHGSSNARAIKNAVLAAERMAARNMNSRIHQELVTNHFGREHGVKTESADHRNGVVRS